MKQPHAYLQELPSRQPTIRVTTMPTDTNYYGDIFGGWLLGQMDLGAGNVAIRLSEGRAVTRSIENAEFKRKVNVGDEISIYAKMEGIGQTSIRILVEAWRRDPKGDLAEPVANAVFIFVAVDDLGRPRKVVKTGVDLHYILGGDRD
ncbi:MAG: acyl-CoA thioesterase [Robiginitomaculum sp.]|nr:MAG: acyl-CoA thioesterase [Robiginitomaculum sp.]